MMKMARKRLFSVVLTLMMAFTIVPCAVNTAYATDDGSLSNEEILASGTCDDNITWQLTGPSEDLTLTIAGEGPMKANWGEDSAPWNEYKNQIKHLVVEEGVTKVGPWAFYEHKGLKTVDLADSVTYIDNLAFYNCIKLQGNLILPSELKDIGYAAFEGCVSLRSVSLPVGFERLHERAFANCDALGPNIYLPYTMEYIDSNTFLNCTFLKSVVMYNNIEIYGYPFNGCPATRTIRCIYDATVPNQTVFEVNGNNIYPEVKVKDIYGTVLEEGVDYSVTYPIESKNPGEYTLGVHGIGYYDFEEQIQYTIKNHEWDEGVVTKASTCIASGTKTYTCSTCGKKRTEAIEPTGSHNYSKSITKASMSKNGQVVNKCSTCGKVASSTTIYRPTKVVLSATTYTCDGKAKRPSVKVTDATGKVIAASNYTVTYASGRKNVGTYKVTVKMKGNYSGSKVVSFKINPKGTSLSKLTAAKKKITAQWKKQGTKMSTSTITGYQIQYSTNKNFKSGNKTITVKGVKSVSKAIGKLPSKKTYYVRVRTYKTVSKVNYYSPWSAAKKVKTK